MCFGSKNVIVQGKPSAEYGWDRNSSSYKIFKYLLKNLQLVFNHCNAAILTYCVIACSAAIVCLVLPSTPLIFLDSNRLSLFFLIQRLIVHYPVLELPRSWHDKGDMNIWFGLRYEFITQIGLISHCVCPNGPMLDANYEAIHTFLLCWRSKRLFLF